MAKNSRKGSPDHAGRRLDEDVAAVLAERDHPEVRELLRLIHAVNPTGHDFSADYTRRRYQQKSALQSLLIQRFGHDLIVERTESDNIVGLRYRVLDLDAAHTSLDSLDEEARAWVRLQLDLQETDAGTAAPRRGVDPSRKREVDPTLAQARAALADYDYPAAREHFERALRDGGGAPDAALPLLELLVDTLAADADALALEPLLSPATARLPAVRGMLALASARLGDRARALALADVAESHAVEAIAALARSAVAAADEEQVVALASRLAELDPSHPELVPLREGLARLRAQAREPMERELGEALARHDAEATTALARRILGRWSESALARRALEEVEAWARRARLEVLLQRVEGAEGEGDRPRALALLREVQQLQPDLPDLRLRLETLAAQVQADDERRSLARVEGLLGSQPDEGLHAYLALPPLLGARVKHEGSRRARERLDRLRLERLAPEACVHAVQALEEVERHAAADPRQILVRLAPHRAILERLAEARALLVAQEGEIADRETRRADERLAEAEQAVASGDWSRGRALLVEVAGSAVQARVGERVKALQGRIEAGEELARLRSAFALAESEGRWLAARDLGDALAERGTGNSPENWKARRVEIDRRVRAQHQHVVDELGERGAPLAHRPEGAVVQLEARFQVAADGALLLVDSHAGWLFVEQVDLDGQQTTRQLRMRLSNRHVDVSTAVEGQSLWVAASDGNAVELSLADGEIRRLRSLREVLEAEACVVDLSVPAGGRYLWVQTDLPGGAGNRVAVVDMASWRTLRSLEDVRVQPVPGAPPLMAALHTRRGGSLHAAGGASFRGSASLPGEWNIAALAPHPSGKGLALWVATPVPEEEILSDRTPEQLGVLLPGASTPIWVEHSDSERINGFGVSLGAQLLFGYCNIEGVTMLLAWETDGRELYRTPMPARMSLFQDLEGRHAVVVAPTETGVGAVRLGREPPTFAVLPRDAAWRSSWTPPYRCYHSPAVPPDDEESPVPEIVELTSDPTPENLALAMQIMEQADPGRKLLAYYLGLKLLRSPEAEKTFAKMLDAKDQSPVIPLYLANVAAERGRWSEAQAEIEHLEMTPKLQAHEQRHLFHLQGLIRFHAGEVEGAVERWKKGAAVEGDDECQLSEAVDLGESMLAVARAQEPHHPMIRALARGEALLVDGDARGALEALDQVAVHQLAEVQSYARLVEAFLRVEPESPVTRFRKAKCLARYLALRSQDRSEARLDIPFAPRWGEERLDTLADRARAWLDDPLRNC